MRGQQPLWIICVTVFVVGASACGAATSPATLQIQQPANTATSESPTATPIKITVEVTRLVTPAADVSTPTPADQCPSSIGAESPEIIIGALLPLSEPGNLLAGFAMQTALNIAVRQLNDTGGLLGRSVRLLTYDTAGTPKQAARFATQLLQSDCAIAIIGGYHDDVAHAISEVAHTFQRPFLIVAAKADSLTAKHYPEVFRLTPSSSQIAETIPQWLTAVGDYNSDGRLFSVRIANNSRTHSVPLEKYGAAFDTLSIRNEVLSVDLPSSDFSPIIARIVAYDALPDALIIQVSGEHAYALQAQLLQAGIGPQKSTLIINHQTILDSDAFWQKIPDGVGTLVFRSGPWRSTVGDFGATFSSLYESYHPSWPEYHAFASFDAMFLIADAIIRTESLQGDFLIQALESTDLMLAAGHYYFPFGQANPPDGNDVQPYMWHQMPAPQLLLLQYAADRQPSAQMPVVWPSTYRSVPTPLVTPTQ